MTLGDIIMRAAELIEQPGKWTKGANARAADGGITMPSNGEAVCWCAHGAVMKFGVENDIYGWAKHMDAIVEFNDRPESTASEVAARMRALAGTLGTST